MYYDVTELSREQLIELKQRYLIELADEGKFAEVGGVDYDYPDWDDLANADVTVPNDVIFRQYEGFSFVPDDFCCTAGQ